MAENTSTIAVVFDFDDTLAPDSTSKFLREHGIDPHDFWNVQAKALIQQGYDQALAFLKLFLDNIGPGRKLGELTNEHLRDFGKTLDGSFYPGLPGLFSELRNIPQQVGLKGISVEFYIVSGGLQAMIEGSAIVRENFKAVYGCQLGGDAEDGPLRYIKRCVTFTEKTRYLFEINKGLDPEETKSNPVLVNKFVDPVNRRVPFRNMLYVGDGLTDIPCFSLLTEKKGWPFAVFDPKKEKSARQTLQEFLRPKRVIGSHSPNYLVTEDLGALLKATVATRCTHIKLERELAETIG